MIRPTRLFSLASGTLLLTLLAGSPFNASWAAPLGTEFTIEPDEYAHQQLLDTISPHVKLSTGAFSDNRPTFSVVAYTEPADASTGSKVFAHAGGIPFWNTNRTFRMDFHSHVNAISLDYIASGFFSDSYAGRLEAYSPTGVLVDSYLTAPLGEGQFETMTVTAPRIAYALAYPTTDPFGDLDHLRFTVVPEPGAILLFAIAIGGWLAVERAPRRSRGLASPQQWHAPRILPFARRSLNSRDSSPEQGVRRRVHAADNLFAPAPHFTLAAPRSLLHAPCSQL